MKMMRSKEDRCRREYSGIYMLCIGATSRAVTRGFGCVPRVRERIRWFLLGKVSDDVRIEKVREMLNSRSAI